MEEYLAGYDSVLLVATKITPRIRNLPIAEAAAMIRPERIRIGAEPGANAVPAVLTGRSFTGESCEWEFEVAGQKLVVTESAPPERKLGETFQLVFPPDQLIVLR